jgi:hypothetical protein
MSTSIKRFVQAACMGAALLVVGCEEPKQAASSTTIVAPPAVENSATGKPAPVAVAPAVPPPVAPPAIAPALPPPVAPGSAIPSAAGERTVAEVGVGAKGRYDSNDYVSTVVSSYFGIQERLAFDLAKRGLNDFKTLHGDYPKTHEQYWKEVIEANSIALPELPDGDEYRYDPESAKRTRGEEALFVVTPKR